jgi:hypothetical protein
MIDLTRVPIASTLHPCERHLNYYSLLKVTFQHQATRRLLLLWVRDMLSYGVAN